jgi:hypothetical protein
VPTAGRAGLTENRLNIASAAWQPLSRDTIIKLPARYHFPEHWEVQPLSHYSSKKIRRSEA